MIPAQVKRLDTGQADAMLQTNGQPNLPGQGDEIKPDRWRFLRVVFFFGGMFLNVLWWEVALRRVLGEQAVTRGRSDRLRRYARRFRRLAVRMGGVMIKLGQFVSARVDVMPPEIIDELAGLQDEVPPVELDTMLAVIEAELGAPADAVFDSFNTEVEAAASLGQVYRARLKDGEYVAVKVQRPGIENLIATDLDALRVVTRWAMVWSVVRRRADVPALLDEFAATLWEEVDYEAEGANADRFRELFADDVRVYIPAIYHDLSTRRVLTMEDVTSIKIMDRAAIDAAGVDRAVAARRLLDIYLKMIFEFGFFHADPHPGNLFIYPLPDDDARRMYAGPPPHDGAPFYLVFVDFGMVGHVTSQVKEGLREALAAVATRDTARVIKAYQMLGVLLPSANLDRIHEAEAEVLDTIWGKSVTEMAQMPREEMRHFVSKYGDLMYELPFQVPQDFIYLGRAIGILSGICTLLDPGFNPWEPVVRYGQRFVQDETIGRLGDWLQEAVKLGGVALGLPRQAQQTLDRIERGDLVVRVRPDQRMAGDLARLRGAANRLTRAVIFGSLLLSATILYISGETAAAGVAGGLAALTWLTIALRIGGRG
jgi:predicted unusual protein kinase regulating ubiquinone biosynthesis (AarF/ABC1/UbiB family)